MENKILAKVNGQEITKADLEFMFSNLNPQIASQFVGPEGEKRLIAELVNQKLLLVDALANKVDETEEFKSEVEKLKENVLSQFAVKRVIDTVQVSDEEAKKFYDENPEYFVSQPQIRASHILVDEEDEANKIYDEIVGGADFADLAAQRSSCPSSAAGGDLNFFSKGQMVPEFEVVAFALELNEVSKPVKTQFGYHIIKLTEKTDGQVASFDDAKESIISNLMAQAQHDKYNSHLDELRKKYTVEITE